MLVPKNYYFVTDIQDTSNKVVVFSYNSSQQSAKNFKLTAEI